MNHCNGAWRHTSGKVISNTVRAAFVLLLSVNCFLCICVCVCMRTCRLLVKVVVLHGHCNGGCWLERNWRFFFFAFAEVTVFREVLDSLVQGSSSVDDPSVSPLWTSERGRQIGRGERGHTFTIVHMCTESRCHVFFVCFMCQCMHTCMCVLSLSLSIFLPLSCIHPMVGSMLQCLEVLCGCHLISFVISAMHCIQTRREHHVLSGWIVFSSFADTKIMLCSPAQTGRILG